MFTDFPIEAFSLYGGRSTESGTTPIYQYYGGQSKHWSSKLSYTDRPSGIFRTRSDTIFAPRSFTVTLFCHKTYTCEEISDSLLQHVSFS